MKTALSALAVALCSSILGIAVVASAHEGHTVLVTDAGFIPKVTTVPAGETITFIIHGSSSHWIASDAHPTHSHYPGSDIRKCENGTAEGVLDTCSGLVDGERFSFAFSESGTWGLHDHLNPTHTGTIEVVGEAGRAEETAGSALTATERLSAWFLKHWYEIFANAGTTKLDGLNMLIVTTDDRLLEYWMRVFGYARIFDAVEKDGSDRSLYGTNFADVLTGQCHTNAHYAGRMAQKLSGLSAMDEVTIDTRCGYGFYHGILEASLGSLGEDTHVRQLAATCAEYDATDPLRAGFCRHGIGHGLMVYHNFDLPEVIEKCTELIPEKRGRQACYHGAFMENVFASFGNGFSDHKTLWVDTTDPDFPCTSDIFPRTDPIFEESCYFNQPLLWGQKNPFGNSFTSIGDFDIETAILGCVRRTGEIRDTCFNGLGFALAFPPVLLTDEKIISYCTLAPEEHDRDRCLVGANFMRSTHWDKNEGFGNNVFCDAMGVSDPSACDAHVRTHMPLVFDI